MQPVITPQEMAAIDAAAPESLKELIDRAGRAVSSQVLEMLGGQKNCRNKKVVVIAGKGNNGADGKRAAELLLKLKVNVVVVSPEDVGTNLKDADLIVDAAYGTGLSRPYEAASIREGIQVLAVDIPSGVDGLTGEIRGSALKADRTITFGASKPGHFLFPGSDFVGELLVDDIGLDVTSSNIWLLDKEAVAKHLPKRPTNAHKWNSACWIIGGSKGMTGSVSLAGIGAYRAGAGYVRISIPGFDSSSIQPIEAVGHSLPATDWGKDVLKESARFKALIVGPGLCDLKEIEDLEKVFGESDKPLVIDGDGLNHLAALGPDALKGQTSVLTPHDAEFERLNGEAVKANRIESARELAAKYKSVVLLKGAVTLIADPVSQKVLISNVGDARLATAGTGDVLAGVIGALLSQGVEPFMAAAMGAFIHGTAASLGSPHGFMASDLGALIPIAIGAIEEIK